LVAVASGLLLLLIFRYTSHQRWIKAVRNYMKANLLALKLFKDNPSVALAAQGRVLLGALLLLLLAIVPMAIMLIPVCLLASQLPLWYQASPLRIGGPAVVTMTFNGPADSSRPDVRLLPSDAIKITEFNRIGTQVFDSVWVSSKSEMCWEIEPLQNGYHRLVF